MSEDVCLSLGLIYDPTIKLNMQSANREVDQLLELVRNVLFQVGDIVLYFIQGGTIHSKEEMLDALEARLKEMHQSDNQGEEELDKEQKDEESGDEDKGLKDQYDANESE
ncbi:uncharacterized protein LAESUDRAFT_764855 [Laetiporus sulphureus 93-53]|uniref:Uncharacterized protein n=1 Tax=Laetiporus sulphureus 93-53 TaxID=1314785 RepID=A0A165B3Q0_9APHY|nr:uncharacterized protein LAESUDRAFT_764855 [Laetiporus sulphureus 93-53]KZT00165.1 hypothetical protein LAESUDRAFT_764855 [Laetiporus sulphureus 93-53]